jgi:hypothetical protein
MNADKTRIFQDFAAKAKRRIEERKQFHTKEYYVKDADVTLTLHGLTEEEISESFDLFEGGDLERDKYVIYLACRELQQAAEIMAAEGSLSEHERYKITEMFSLSDRRYLAEEVLKLSGVGTDCSVEPVSEVAEIKN